MFPEQVHCCVAGPGWKLKSVNHSHCCTQPHRVKKRAADVAVLFNKFVSDVTANNTFLSAKSGKKNNNKKKLHVWTFPGGGSSRSATPWCNLCEHLTSHPVSQRQKEHEGAAVSAGAKLSSRVKRSNIKVSKTRTIIELKKTKKQRHTDHGDLQNTRDILWKVRNRIIFIQEASLVLLLNS